MWRIKRNELKLKIFFLICKFVKSRICMPIGFLKLCKFVKSRICTPVCFRTQFAPLLSWNAPNSLLNFHVKLSWWYTEDKVDNHPEYFYHLHVVTSEQAGQRLRACLDLPPGLARDFCMAVAKWFGLAWMADWLMWWLSAERVVSNTPNQSSLHRGKCMW